MCEIKHMRFQSKDDAYDAMTRYLVDISLVIEITVTLDIKMVTFKIFISNIIQRTYHIMTTIGERHICDY